MDETTSVVCILGAVILLITIFFVIFKHRRTDTSVDRVLEVESYNGTDTQSKFTFSNHLEKPIRLKISHVSVPKIKEIKSVLAKGIHAVNLKSIAKYIKNGTQIDVYTYDNTKPGDVFYGSYQLNLPEGTTLKNLNIGMMTSRWVGADGDYTIGAPGMAAVQGMPWIKIHNFSGRYLALNNNINISPGGFLRYTGRDHFGVRLGTVFKDQDGIYPDFVLSRPATDVYYGVSSDIQQPLYGGFQLTHHFEDDPREPQNLLNEGMMGGPAWGKIPYGFLPINGPDVPPQNRWGERITSEDTLQNPVGPPVIKNNDSVQ